MSNATAPKALAGATPRTIHAGAITVAARYTCSACHSATDVISMVKIPNGAVIDDVVLCHSGDAGSAPAIAVIQVGDSVSAARYASASWSATLVLRATAGLGHRVSLSDDASVMYQTINLTMTAGVISVSHVLELIVSYHMDDSVL
jgi:hypothetical protein